MREAEILKRVLLAAYPAGAVLFRNNVGTGWTGQTIRTREGGILLPEPRPLHAGLHKGSGDAIGWKTVVITPDMVGQQVAVFLSVETKSATGRLAPDQANWLRQVNTAGGIAMVVRSPQEFARLLAEKFG